MTRTIRRKTPTEMIERIRTILRVELMTDAQKLLSIILLIEVYNMKKE